MSDQIISRIDDMGTRIDDLEHNINDLMAQVFIFHKNMNFHIMPTTDLTKVNIAGGSERRPSSPGKQRPGRPQVILYLVFLIREVVKKSKWKFLMAFAIRGEGGGLEGVSFAIKLF